MKNKNKNYYILKVKMDSSVMVPCKPWKARRGWCVLKYDHVLEAHVMPMRWAHKNKQAGPSFAVGLTCVCINVAKPTSSHSIHPWNSRT